MFFTKNGVIAAFLDVGVVSPEKIVFGSRHRDHRARVLCTRSALEIVSVDVLEISPAELG